MTAKLYLKLLFAIIALCLQVVFFVNFGYLDVNILGVVVISVITAIAIIRFYKTRRQLFRKITIFETQISNQSN